MRQTLALAAREAVIPRIGLGDRIKIARKHAGFKTASDFAKAMNVSLPTATRWEGETREPTASMLRLIAQVCGVDLAWLMEGLAPAVQAERKAESELPARLYESRRIADCDVETMASILEVEPHIVVAYETGWLRPEYASLVHWADETSVDLEWLVYGHEPDARSLPTSRAVSAGQGVFDFVEAA